MMLPHTGFVVTRLKNAILQQSFMKIVHNAFGFMLCIYTRVILSLIPSIFLKKFLPSKMKKPCFDIINHNSPPNLLNYNNPLKRTNVAFFNLKYTIRSSPHRNSKSFHDL